MDSLTFRCRTCGKVPCQLRARYSERPRNRHERRSGMRTSLLPTALVTVCCGATQFDRVDDFPIAAELKRRLDSGELQEIVSG